MILNFYNTPKYYKKTKDALNSSKTVNLKNLITIKKEVITGDYDFSESYVTKTFLQQSFQFR
ncbi:hypothetical protein EGM88_11995 [Aureibaculum marinum]|uniref:Uncharacterized protein n=1 Tax=Aureibaculum marinum TaxID=2487930 RepID=A0A3N4NJ86_9FLAO|nr:hypothetical protein EGM88_11995 [Aureibaculum marinum]